VLFLAGVEIGFLKIGESIGNALVKTGHLAAILTFTAILGFAVTLLEPDVQVFILQAADAVAGLEVLKTTIVVAIGIGIFLALAFLRLFIKIPMKYITLVVFTICFVLVAICKNNGIASVAFDASGATTGALTTPFVISLAMGITSMISRKSSTSSAFGILGIASMGPILLILLMEVLGI